MPQPAEPAGASPPASSPRLLAAAPYLVFLGVTLLVFGPPLLRGDAPAPPDVLSRMWPWKAILPSPPPESPVGFSDPATYIYPTNAHYAAALRRGEIPFWNPHLFAGYPMLATGQIGWAYPVKWLLFYVAPFPHAFVLYLAIHFWAAGAAMAWLLRDRGVGRFGACMGGLCWMLCEANAFFLRFDGHLVSCVWLPLTIGFIGRAFSRRSPAWACAAGLAFGCGILGGYFQRMYYAGLLVGVWAVVEGVRAGRRERRARAGLAAPALAALALAVGAAVGAPALAPFVEIQKEPIRHAVPFTDLFPAPWERAACLVTLLAPRILGGCLDPMDAFPSLAQTTFHEFMAYVGLLPLALAVGAALGPCRRSGLFYSLTAAAALLLLLGTPLSRIAYHAVPGFDRSDPFRLFWLWAFGVSALAGLGADALGRGESAKAAAWRRLAGALLLGAGLLVAAGAACWIAVAAGAQHPKLRWGDLRNPAIFEPAATMGLAGAVVLALRSRRRVRAVKAAAVLLATAELLLLLLPMNPFAPPETMAAETPVLRRLVTAAREGPPFRTVGRRKLPYWDWPVVNALLPYGLDSPEGSEAMRPARYSEFIAATAGRRASDEPFRRSVLLGEVAGLERLFGFLNVRFVLADPGEALPLPGWRATTFPDATLYENPSPLPRAFVVPREEVIPDAALALARLAAPTFDYRSAVVLRESPPEALAGPSLTQGTVTVTRPSSNAVALDVRADGSGYVALSETYFEGWEARRNGAPCPLMRANHAFRAVAIPGAGTWRIEMAYKPRWWPGALYLSLAGAVVGVLGWGVARRRGLTTGNSKRIFAP